MAADKLIDSLQFYWNYSDTKGPWTKNGPRIKSCPSELSLLEDALTLQYWELHLESWCSLVVSNLFSAAKVQNYSIAHPGETAVTRESKGEDEIIISDQFGEVRMSAGAFERLMNRYFNVLLYGIPLYKKKWLSSHMHSWKQLHVIARLLQAKARP